MIYRTPSYPPEKIVSLFTKLKNFLLLHKLKGLVATGIILSLYGTVSLINSCQVKSKIRAEETCKQATEIAKSIAISKGYKPEKTFCSFDDHGPIGSDGGENSVVVLDTDSKNPPLNVVCKTELMLCKVHTP